MSYSYELVVLGGLLALGLLVALEIGRRIAVRRVRLYPEKGFPSFGIIDTSMFGLMGLLVAFAFNGAAGRYDYRRTIESAEANAIGTAWLRLDLLSPPARTSLQSRMREYLDLRIRIMRLEGTQESLASDVRRFAIVRSEIWSAALSDVGRSEKTSDAILMLPALNEMFDRGDQAVAAAMMHVPRAVIVLLVIVSLVSAMLAGYSTAGSPHRSWFHQIVFSVILSLTILVTLNLEYPRLGFLRLDREDLPMLAVREAMN